MNLQRRRKNYNSRLSRHSVAKFHQLKVTKNSLTLTVQSDEQVQRLPGDLWMPVIRAVCPTSNWETGFKVPACMEKEWSMPLLSPAHTSQPLQLMDSRQELSCKVVGWVELVAWCKGGYKYVYKSTSSTRNLPEVSSSLCLLCGHRQPQCSLCSLR